MQRRLFDVISSITQRGVSNYQVVDAQGLQLATIELSLAL